MKIVYELGTVFGIAVALFGSCVPRPEDTNQRLAGLLITLMGLVFYFGSKILSKLEDK